MAASASTRHFEDRRGEVAGDAVVAPGAGEPRGQEAGIERLAAGGMACQHRRSGRGASRSPRRKAKKDMKDFDRFFLHRTRMTTAPNLGMNRT